MIIRMILVLLLSGGCIDVKVVVSVVDENLSFQM